MNLENYTKMTEDFWKLAEMLGRTGELFNEYYSATYADGALDSKTKRLMAMCGAIASGCDGCVIGQAKKAIELGATKEEITEACAVGCSLGGTMASTKAALVLQLMRDKGLL